MQCVEEGCGEEATEEEIKQEGWNVTLEVRSNKTATFKWTGTQIKEPSIVNFTIKKDKMVDDDGNEYSYSYINGVIKIETENGTTWWFK